MRGSGYIVRFFPDKGYGFIAAHGVGPKRLFFRRTDVVGSVETVSYELIVDGRDRSRAVAVMLERHATS
jgi:hypothetical protein